MCFSNEGENVSVLPIVGIGGLGKTALTQLVYSEDRVVRNFDTRIWICVSEDFEIKSVVKKILKSSTNDEVENLNLKQLQIRLQQKLNGKRYLLILDDVWNEIYEKWAPVKNLLMCGAKGSKIVVSTRSGTVASYMGTENPYMLKGLTEDQSWTLFEKVAFRGYEMVPPNLEVIGKEIIERCKGVPLAIRSVASVLQSKSHASQWSSIRSSDIWSSCEDDSDILPILKLSYDNLPMHLRPCFSYCSIFPKDHIISKEKLIQLWMAQGYVQSSNGSLEDIGDQYFRILWSRSFFQDVEVDEYYEVRSCKMHDLIHDLAVKVSGSDCSVAETSNSNISERVHHVSYRCNLEKLPPQLLKAKGLRTLLTPRLWLKASGCKLISSNFRCLRVLEVHHSWFEKVPETIGKLQHLRYLDLSNNWEMTSLPNSIRSLINLQALKLSGCSMLQRLPIGITKLINLRYLMNDGCWQLHLMPTGLGKLNSLRRLPVFCIGGGRRRGNLQLSELNGLNELRGDLSIEGLETVRDVKSESKAANLMAKKYLYSLTLKWNNKRQEGSKLEDVEMLEGLQPHPEELRELSIYRYSGGMFPSWMTMGNMVSSLPNLVRITLFCCYGCRHLPPSLDQLLFLKFLKLYNMDRVEYIDDDDNNNNPYLARRSSSSSSSLFFPSLEELEIVGLPNLEGWWRRAAGTGTGTVVVNDCLTSSSSSQRPSFPCLIRLKIWSCPKLTSMPMHIPHMEVLSLVTVPEKLLRQLLLSTTTTTTATPETSEGSVSSSTIPSSKLRSLHIVGIYDLEFLPEEVLQNLTSLRSFTIRSCETLTSLSPPETQYYLPALQDFSIGNCKNFDLSGDGVHWHGLRSLLTLEIIDFPRLTFLPMGIQHITTLQRLEITRCSGLMALPEWIKNLSSLQWLGIFGCPLLSERCRAETGDQWPKISHVSNISIDGYLIRGNYFIF